MRTLISASLVVLLFAAAPAAAASVLVNDPAGDSLTPFGDVRAAGVGKETATTFTVGLKLQRLAPVGTSVDDPTGSLLNVGLEYDYAVRYCLDNGPSGALTCYEVHAVRLPTGGLQTSWIPLVASPMGFPVGACASPGGIVSAAVKGDTIRWTLNRAVHDLSTYPAACGTPSVTATGVLAGTVLSQMEAFVCLNASVGVVGTVCGIQDDHAPDAGASGTYVFS